MKRLGDLLGDFQPPQRQPARTRDGSRRVTPPAEEACPICKGKGFLVRDVPYGDPISAS